MTKQFLITVQMPEAPLSQPDEYLRNELEQFGEALFDYHAGGHFKTTVRCLLLTPFKEAKVNIAPYDG